MSLILQNLQFCKELCVTVGDMTPPAALTLEGPPDGFESIIGKIGNGNEGYFFLRHGFSWMRFRGTVTNPDQLSVDTVLNSSDGGNPLILGPGVKQVYVAMDEYEISALFDIYIQAVMARGTWTPTLGGSATYTARNGVYEKIGRTVHVACQVQVNAIGSGSTTTIFGLPYPARVTGPAQIGSAWWSGAVANLVTLVPTIQSNSSQIVLYSIGAAAAGLSQNAIFTNGTLVYVTMTYETEDP